MKEQQQGKPSREELFEAQYGYPPRLFDSVMAVNAIEDETVLAEMIEMHKRRLQYIDDLMKR